MRRDTIAAPPPLAPSRSAESGAPEHLPPVPTTATRPRHVEKVRFTDVRSDESREAIAQLGHLGVFDSTTGLFHPKAPIARSQYVRWLVRANNAFFAMNARKQIAPSAGRESSFADLPASHRDFAYVQGMADAGFRIGIDAWHFAPGRWLTREELLAILLARDKNGVNESPAVAGPPVDIIRDGAKVSRRYWQLLRDDQGDMSISTHDNLNRTFGGGDLLYPKRAVTRAEAARRCNGSTACTPAMRSTDNPLYACWRGE